MFVTQQQRRDTAANWTSVNPVLLPGEMGLETDTNKFKFGDGITAWVALPYASTGGGGGGAVSSVFTRTGAVVAQSGDYSVGQVTGAAPLASPAFTGTPTTPTATPLTNTTQAASTAYADAAVLVEKNRALAAEGLSALKANNLSDLSSASTARSNLGLGTAAVQNTSAFLQPTNNLSDVSNRQTAMNNLAGGTNAGQFLRANGTNVVLAPIAPADVQYQPWQFPVQSGLTNGSFTGTAKGDGIVVTDAVMTSGSANLACTTSVPFTSTIVDQNKYILVSGAGGGTYSPKMFQISTVTDSGHVVLNATASSTTSGTPGAIAYFGTDDTAAIQNAINAAVTYAQAHNGYAEVIFSDKIYIIAGAFILGNGTTLFGNYQIGLPNITPGSAQQVILSLKGPMETTPLMHWQQLSPQASGAILASVRTDGTNDATYGPASVIGCPIFGFTGEPGLYSNCVVQVRGLGMLLPYNATMCGLDLFSILEADVNNFSCMTAAVVPNTSAPSPSLFDPTHNISNQYTFGLRMPSTGNQVVCRVSQYSSEGMCYGICPSEWTYGEDIHVMYAIIAVAMWTRGIQMVHSALLVEVQAENCVNALGPNGTGNSQLDVINFQTESIGANKIVYDPSSQLQGTIQFRPQGQQNVYVTGGWLQGGVGGNFLRLINNMTTPGPIASPQAPPATGVAWGNFYYRDAWITLSIATGSLSTLLIDAVDQAIPTGCVLWTFLLPAGHSYTPTYTGTLTHNVTLM